MVEGKGERFRFPTSIAVRDMVTSVSGPSGRGTVRRGSGARKLGWRTKGNDPLTHNAMTNIRGLCHGRLPGLQGQFV
jgi:hypothetical protein